VLADCFTRGACGGAGGPVDVGTAAAVVAAAVGAQDGAGAPGQSYAELGWVPFGVGSGSYTLEYAIDDAAAATLAALAGVAANATLFAARAGSYKNVWCAPPFTMCPRFANGSFLVPPSLTLPHPFDPYYTEGDAVQWQWAVPHDAAGLLALFPSPDAYVAALTGLMANQTAWPLGTFLPNPWYWAGNEPDMLAPWQFAAAGGAAAWRTAYWSRWNLRAWYTPDEDGIPGNDDYGALASWGVWAALGLYPIAATDPPVYAIGSPLFANASITVPKGWGAGRTGLGEGGGGGGSGGGVLTITAHNASAGNVFVAAAAVNGVPLPSAIVTHAALFGAGGGGGGGGGPLLEVWMTSEPVVWGSGGQRR
jgi:putative alpha-1,2-mannosidase